MEETTPNAAPLLGGSSRFELAPPRRFILPAILLLLSERPGYGYGLVPSLQELRFGHVDRPAVYRALGSLERDGFVEAAAQNPTAGPARRVYRVTPLGERVLRAWMGVVKEEHDRLGQVLRRYQATGRPDAVLAEVEGGWAAALGAGWSSVSPTSAGYRHLAALQSDPAEGAGDQARAGDRATAGDNGRAIRAPEPRIGRFQLLPDRSVVLIEVRSTVGPLSFGSIGLTGTICAAIAGGVLRTDLPPSAHIQVDVAGLRSGNTVYDAELLRRIEARRFPSATVDLRGCETSGPGSLYRLAGELTFHGVTRPAQGTVRVEEASDLHLVVTGEQVFDIRDFAVPSPTVLMLRIYPDVRVLLHLEAELIDTETA
ncbi:MAG: helix-turn-helix transcriptional regulator [Acidimicrobiales bacterium]